MLLIDSQWWKDKAQIPYIPLCSIFVQATAAVACFHYMPSGLTTITCTMGHETFWLICMSVFNRFAKNELTLLNSRALPEQATAKHLCKVRELTSKAWDKYLNVIKVLFSVCVNPCICNLPQMCAFILSEFCFLIACSCKCERNILFKYIAQYLLFLHLMLFL